MSQSATQIPTQVLPAALRARLVGIVDSLPETAGLGVVCFEDRQLYRLRSEADSGATVVFEVRDTPSRQDGTTSGAVPPRNTGTSPAMEWVSAGFNCGGAVLAWIGVAGTSALSPVTGGLSIFASAALWGGAVAASTQCMVSGYRIYNMEHGRTAINNQLDNNDLYVFTMNALDAVGILGAGGALKEVAETHAILGEVGSSWSMGTSGRLSRPMRRRLTTALELHSGKRASAAVIDQLLRQRLLDATAGAIGLVGSGTTGLLRSLVVWITTEASNESSSQ